MCNKSGEESPLYSGVESIVQYKVHTYVHTYIHSPNCTLHTAVDHVIAVLEGE